MDFSSSKTRAFFRLALSRVVSISGLRQLRDRFGHSLDKPFGDKYYLDRAKNYDKDRENQPSWQAEYAAIEKFAHSIGRNMRVLDVPVGSGRFFPLYQELNWIVTGLDISRDMLAVCRKRSLREENQGKPFLVLGHSDSLPFENESFDVVVCFRFLQSIVDFETASNSISEFARVSSKFVLLHIDVGADSTNLISEISPRETMRGKLGWEQMVELLDSSGLKIVEALGPMPSEARNEHVILCSRVGL